MSMLSQFAGGSIKSIQRGVITMSSGSSATATVSSVDTAKSILHFLGNTTSSSGGSEGLHARLTLTNATTITATRGLSVSDTTAVSWQLVEYF